MFEQMNNNKVHIKGKILSSPKYTHQVYDEEFYEINLEVPRLSSSVDIIPVTVSSKVLEDYDFSIGNILSINGQFRSYNKQVDGKSKLVLTVFAREILVDDNTENPNNIELTGYVCKEPVFRTTPFKREICDVLIAVNRAYNKSDYLPCIAWGRNARYVKNIEVGEKISLIGRIQSREYEKRLPDDSTEKRIAYEISITKIAKFNEVDKLYEHSNIIYNESLTDTTNYSGAN